MTEDGVDAVRLDRVAALAGCSRSSLYRYFDTKEELIIAVLSRTIEQMSKRIAYDLSAIDDPTEHLVQGIARAVELTRSDPHLAMLISEPNSRVVMKLAASALPRLVGPLLGKVLPLGDGQSLLRDDVPPDEAARWIGMVTAGLLTFDSERADDREALLTYLRRFLVPSLFTK